MGKLRILLADDHRMIRDGLKLLINAQPDMEVVGEAGDGLAACQQAKSSLPDVVVMDISMPQMSGARATERIKRERPEVKVIALTAHEERSYVSQLLEAGVSGYMLKVAASQDLINAIRVVAAGGIYLDPAVADKVLERYRGGKSPKGVLQGAKLSQREEEVLRLIAEGYINKEIAVRLSIGNKTVETHKARAMEKLGLHSRAAIVRYALDQGWLQNK
jgi:two-component system response regulator NreC